LSVFDFFFPPTLDADFFFKVVLDSAPGPDPDPDPDPSTPTAPGTGVPGPVAGLVGGESMTECEEDEADESWSLSISCLSFSASERSSSGSLGPPRGFEPGRPGAGRVGLMDAEMSSPAGFFRDIEDLALPNADAEGEDVVEEEESEGMGLDLGGCRGSERGESDMMGRMGLGSRIVGESRLPSLSIGKRAN
jgi:hypothetical protein